MRLVLKSTKKGDIQTEKRQKRMKAFEKVTCQTCQSIFLTYATLAVVSRIVRLYGVFVGASSIPVVELGTLEQRHFERASKVLRHSLVFVRK